MTDLAVREFVDQFGELPAYLVLDYIAEMSNTLAGIPPNGAHMRLAQWLLAVKSGASDEAEYFADEIPPGYPKWLRELMEFSSNWLGDWSQGWGQLQFMETPIFDEINPGRSCWCCFHPRNSAECNFGHRHPRHDVEMFKGY